MSKEKRPCRARFVVGMQVAGFTSAVQSGTGMYDGVLDVAEIDTVEGRKLDEPILVSTKTAIIQLLRRP